MKKLLFALFFTPFFCFSQYENPERVIKVSLSSLPFSGFTLQYEKVASKRISFGLGASYRPKSLIPYGATVEKAVRKYGAYLSGFSFEKISIQNTKEGNLSFTPEMRVYLGGKYAPYGFYLSIFGKVNFYKLEVPTTILYPYHNQDVSVTLPVNFTVNAYSGGLMLGYQIRISKSFSLDLYALGGHYGISKINGIATQDLTKLNNDEKEILRLRIIDSFKISDKYFNVKVDDSGATIDQTGNVPYIGLRMLGLNLGVTF